MSYYIICRVQPQDADDPQGPFDTIETYAVCEKPQARWDAKQAGCGQYVIEEEYEFSGCTAVIATAQECASQLDPSPAPPVSADPRSVMKVAEERGWNMTTVIDILCRAATSERVREEMADVIAVEVENDQTMGDNA